MRGLHNGREEITQSTREVVEVTKEEEGMRGGGDRVRPSRLRRRRRWPQLILDARPQDLWVYVNTDTRRKKEKRVKRREREGERRSN